MPDLAAPAVPAGSVARLGQPVLPAADLVLRPWKEADAAAVAAAHADPDIRQWHVRSMTADEASLWIAAWPGRWAQETAASWAIATDSGVLGQVGLRSIDLAAGRAAVSYWVAPEARGRGVATRALRTMSSWAFERLGLHRLELEHSARNPSSCRVAVRAGYRAEGTKRAEGLHADGWHDMHLHARLAGDPP